MAKVLGHEAKLYRQTTGTRATWPASGSAPDLSEITNVKDLTLNFEKGEADLTTRGNNGWVATAGTLKNASVDFDMVWDNDDAAFNAIQEAYFNNTSIAFAVFSGASDVVGVKGLWADCEVMNFSVNEPLTDALTVSVTLKPAYSSVAPEWVTVN